MRVCVRVSRVRVGSIVVACALLVGLCFCVAVAVVIAVTSLQKSSVCSNDTICGGVQPKRHHSVQPKRMWIAALEHPTRTKTNDITQATR